MKAFRVTALLLIGTLLIGCGKREKSYDEDRTESYRVTAEGTIFGGRADDRIAMEVSYNPEWITKADNTGYNKKLAQFAAILCDDVYFRDKDLDKGTQNRVLYEDGNGEAYDRATLLKKLGFSEVRYVESFKEKEYTGDSNDSATFLLAHTVVDGKYDLYAVVFRGCFSAQEWLSMFDPGSAGEAYEAYTGQHPEWSDRDVHKGLAIAKNRALSFIDEFIGQNDNPDLENCILVTGHSRGGALANLIGAEMENRSDMKSYTYTFSAPGVTVNREAGKYNTIFNVFDRDDFYTEPLVFGSEEFVRYGRDCVMAIDDSEELKAEIAKLKGRDDYCCMEQKAREEFLSSFAGRFADRASLYREMEIAKVFDTEEEATAYEERCRLLIGADNGLGLEAFCRIERSGQGQVVMYYCGAGILAAYAKTLAYGKAAYEAATELFAEDESTCKELRLLMEQATGLTGGHLLINMYAACGYGRAEEVFLRPVEEPAE